MKIAVIGAGPSGLCSAKNAIDQEHNVTIFEQNEELGGLWVYDENIGKNKYGVNIHTAIYEGLIANSPYQLTAFPGHNFPKGIPGFPSQKDVLKYLHSYADRYHLKNLIKYCHIVIRVLPIENEKWEIIVKDLENDKFFTETFDVVFVCNGHTAKPNIPLIEGTHEFKGEILHSHDVRRFDKFRGEKVLIIGANISGVELVVILSVIANEITLSCNKDANVTEESRKELQKNLPTGVVIKDNVKRIFNDGAEFIDGTKKTFSTIIFATGYRFAFPYLSVESGIHVDDNHVQPLYKHIFNIEHPTMVFIGVPLVPAFFLGVDLQARCVLKFLSGQKKLPSKDEMLRDLQNDIKARYDEGCRKSKMHKLFNKQRVYFNEISKLADIQNVPVVFDALWEKSLKEDISKHPKDFRKFRYNIIDDENFTKEIDLTATSKL